MVLQRAASSTAEGLGPDQLPTAERPLCEF